MAGVRNCEHGASGVDDDALDQRAIEIASRLANGAQAAIKWTKYALNNWLRQAGPTFDASLALEFLGFDSPEVKEGLASHLEKRAPIFPNQSPRFFPCFGSEISLLPKSISLLIFADFR